MWQLLVKIFKYLKICMLKRGKGRGVEISRIGDKLYDSLFIAIREQ